MRIFNTLLIFSFTLLSALYNTAIAQIEEDSLRNVDNKVYVVETNDGSIFMGTILHQDAKEVLILTKDRGEISIPKYQVKSIKEVEQDQINAKGQLVHREVFSTRYFLTTNSLPVVKGENYALVNFYGPEVHFGVTDNFGIGVMTSWIGVPVVLTLKQSFKLGDKTNIGVGVLAGWGSFLAPSFVGALPFATLTFGDRRANFNISAGYISIGEIGYGSDLSSPLLSFAGLAKIGEKFSFVFDSFIVPSTGTNTTGALVMPGFRFQVDPDKAFQFAFGGTVVDGGVFPFPSVGWFRKF